MNHIEVPDRNLTLYLPENLGECDTRQYIEMAELIYSYQTGKTSYPDFKIAAVYVLLNLKKGKSKSRNRRDQTMSNIAKLSDYIDSFFVETEEAQRTIVQDYVNNHIPFVYPIFRKYRGPLDLFEDTTWGEYSDSVNLMMEYEKHKDPELLYQIMATFYRPNKFFSWLMPKHKRRSDYDDRAVPERAKLMKLLHPGEIYGFYLFLTSFHKFLPTAKIYLNGEEIEMRVIFDTNGSSPKSGLPSIGFKSLEYVLSESGVFGDIDKVRKTRMWDVLVRLYDMFKRDKDEEARLKELRKNDDQ